MIHAGTARRGRRPLVTAGGRVLAVGPTGTDVADARAKAYAGVDLDLVRRRAVAPDIAAEPLGVVEGASLTRGLT